MNTSLAIGQALQPERKLWDGAYGVALANTNVEGRKDRPALRRFDDLLLWGERARILNWSDSDTLRGTDLLLPEEALLARARDLRDLAVRVVAAGRARQRPRGDDLGVLNQHFVEALAHLCVQGGHGSYTVAFDDDTGVLDRLFALVSLSLANLLTSGEIWHVRGCDGPGCRFVFVDRGRGPGRRWCDMKTCGSVHKSRLQVVREREYREQERELERLERVRRHRERQAAQG